MVFDDVLMMWKAENTPKRNRPKLPERNVSAVRGDDVGGESSELMV